MLNSGRLSEREQSQKIPRLVQLLELIKEEHAAIKHERNEIQRERDKMLEMIEEST